VSQGNSHTSGKGPSVAVAEHSRKSIEPSVDGELNNLKDDENVKVTWQCKPKNN
jgi:hypothetical protein